MLQPGCSVDRYTFLYTQKFVHLSILNVRNFLKNYTSVIECFYDVIIFECHSTIYLSTFYNAMVHAVVLGIVIVIKTEVNRCLHVGTLMLRW